MKQVLITGITGTLGNALSKLLLDQGIRILGISRDEQKQRQMPVHDNLALKLADVRDPVGMQRAVGNLAVDRVFHLAALKCVDTLEFHPYEAYMTNVIGTQNVVDLADHLGAGLVLTSTDKACYPVNTYGYTKALAEKLVLAAGQTVVRYGNVMGSRGSFVPSLIHSLKDEHTAYLTDKSMTRFWMSVNQAASLVSVAEGPGLHLPDGIKAATLPALTEAVARFCGVENYEIVETGIRPGEKIHETLRIAEEGDIIRSNSPHVQFGSAELLQFISDVMGGRI